jgi:hypothetical protein
MFEEQAQPELFVAASILVHAATKIRMGHRSGGVRSIEA